MSKFILRLLVVIILIAGITTAVYFIINKPDESKQLYSEYISLNKTEKYQNFDYLTKEWSDTSTSTTTSLVQGNSEIANHYSLLCVIKTQIEENLLLINYAQSYDEVAQKAVSEKLKVYNDKAYGDFGVTYQAKYLYSYYTSGNIDVTTVAELTNNLLIAMHDMEVVGYQALAELSNYVKTYVYKGEKPNDAKYVINDAYATLVGAVSSYENTTNDDMLYSIIGNYQNYLNKFKTLVANGEQNGYNALNVSAFINAYNALDRTLVCDLFKSTNKSDFIKSQSGATKSNLTIVYNFMEASL